MSVFDTMNDILFAHADLALAAVYTPPAGSPVDCRVVENRSLELVGYDSKVIEGRQLYDVRTSEVATMARGGTLQVGATTYTVDAEVANDGQVLTVAVK